MKRFYGLVLGVMFSLCGWAQSSGDLLNFLIQEKVVSADKADSLKARFNRSKSTAEKRFTIDGEYRIRPEYRDGYGQLPNDTTPAAFVIGQRSRFNMKYVHHKRFTAYVSLQDIRIWGQQDPKSTTPSTFHVFEAWAEPVLAPGLSIRIGRQRLIYDNQRLFSDNNWRTSAASHDAAVLKYDTKSLKTDFVLAYNQSADRLRGTDYTPAGFTYHKLLLMHYLKTRLIGNLSLTLINAADGHQDLKNAEKLQMRYTDGGRLDYKAGKVLATLSGYYQWGKLNNDKKLTAWYVQPEVQWQAHKKVLLRLGSEVFSGTAQDTPSDEDHSFVPLIGSGHSFNGSLDLITKFPSDIGGLGLLNPYLFVLTELCPRLDLRADFHYFQLMETYTANDKEYDAMLGFENDWLLTFKPNSNTRVEAGFSYALTTETFEKIRKAQPESYKIKPYFIYLSVSFKPELLNYFFN